MNVEADEEVCVEVAKGEFAPSLSVPGVLVHPHLHDMTRFVWEIVSFETLEFGAVRNALFEKSMVGFGVQTGV